MFFLSTIQKPVIFYYALYVLLTVLDPDTEKFVKNWQIEQKSH